MCMCVWKCGDVVLCTKINDLFSKRSARNLDVTENKLISQYGSTCQNIVKAVSVVFSCTYIIRELFFSVILKFTSPHTLSRHLLESACNLLRVPPKQITWNRHTPGHRDGRMRGDSKSNSVLTV